MKGHALNSFPRQRPRAKEPLERDTPELRPPGQRLSWKVPPSQNGQKSRHRGFFERTWDQAAIQEVMSLRDPLPPVKRMTDRCKTTGFICESHI